MLAKEVDCSDEIPEGGEGRGTDYLLQNDRLTAIVRAPAEGLTLLHAAGGTLVDLAPAGEVDPLREAVPLIEGGWMTPDALEYGTDDEGAWLTVSGPGAALPDLGEGSADRVSVTWRLRPDADWIEAAGVEAIYVQPNNGAELAGQALASGGVRLMGRGAIEEDFGGAVVFAGDALLAGPASAVAAARWPEGDADTIAVSGTCGGDAVEIHDGGAVVATLGAEFDARAPAGSTLRCVAEGRDPGDETPAGGGLALSAGELGHVRLQVLDDDGQALRAVATIDGVAHALPPEPTAVPAGTGARSVRVDAGPAFAAWEGDVDAPTRTIEVVLDRVIDDAGWVLLDLDRAPAPSRYSLETPDGDLALAAAAGVGFAVQAPPDEVGAPFVTSETSGLLRYQGGTRTELPGAGAILSWPWSADSKRSGHGAIKWQHLTPETALAQAARSGRRTAVDADWLAAAGPAHTWFPAPDFVWLRSLDDLGAYVAVLESGYRSGAIGPLTWTPADTSSLPSVAAAERGLFTSASVAGTGPLLEIAEIPTPPRPGRTDRRFQLRLQAAEREGIDRVAIWADGAEVASWEVTGAGLLLDEEIAVEVERWVLAVASGGEGWAVTAPVWLVEGELPGFGVMMGADTGG